MIRINKQPFFIHNHTEDSNFRLSDSINKAIDVLDKACNMGLPGICITDHETVSSHIGVYKHYSKNKEKFKDFKLGYGNEIYLISEEDSKRAEDDNEKVKYHHFILLAKNENGYKGIRELSSLAWLNSYTHRGMQRVPLFYHQLEEIMKKYKGDIIGATACLGGEIPQLLLKTNNMHEPVINIHDYIKRGEDDKVKNTVNRILGKESVRDNKLNLEKMQETLSYTKKELECHQSELDNKLDWFENVFGEDFYIELQPGDRKIQQVVNKLLYKEAHKRNIKPIVTTDAHYLDLSKQALHEAYLNSKMGDREVMEFYSTTYLMDRDELNVFFDDEILDELIENTRYIMDSIEDIEFGKGTQIPKAHIPTSFNTDYIDFYRKYPEYKHIQTLLDTDNKQNQYYLHLIYEGYKSKYDIINKNWSIEDVLERIDLEMEQIVELSDYFKQSMSGYFLFVKELVDVIWEVSFVAPNRGSAACWITNYLLDITQFNPLDYDLPYWRFLHIARGKELPDIDLDLQSNMRDNVIETIREEYGYDKVLQLATYTTEGVSSSILTSCSGLGVDNIVAKNISNLANTDLSLRDQILGNKEDGVKPNKKLIQALNKHDNLKESVLELEGLIKGRGSHAGGIVVFNDGYIEEGNALMKTTSGTDITQFDGDDTEFLGGMKIDLLSTDALTRLRTAFDLLLEHGEIEWQGSLRETYNKYLHPDALDYSSSGMYDMLFDGDVISAFQFSTDVGDQTLRKVNARTFNDLSIANSLMRLTTRDSEQPIDKYVRFRDDISQWYDEMSSCGLNYKEVDVLKEHLSSNSGICDTQESLMQLAMDDRITGYTLEEANKFRKLVAKANQEELKLEYDRLLEHAEELGNRKELVDYVYNYCYKPMFGYAFSVPK